MTNQKIEILYYFMNENVILTEAKRMDLPSSSDKSLLYYWIKINAQTQNVERLTFKSMTTEVVNGNEISVRVFEDGELRFDKFFAKFQHRSEGQILMNSEAGQVPEIFLNKIEQFITEN